MAISSWLGTLHTTLGHMLLCSTTIIHKIRFVKLIFTLFFTFGSTRMFFPFPEQYGFTIRRAAIQCRYLIIIVLVNHLISNQVGHLCQSKYNPHVKWNIIVVVVVMVAQNLKHVVGSFIVTLKLVFSHVTRTLTLILHFDFQSDTSENFDSVLLCF